MKFDGKFPLRGAFRPCSARLPTPFAVESERGRDGPATHRNPPKTGQSYLFPAQEENLVLMAFAIRTDDGALAVNSAKNGVLADDIVNLGDAYLKIAAVIQKALTQLPKSATPMRALTSPA
jgi:hypothetical protein